MGTSGSGSTADVSDEITADTLGIVSGTKIVTATSKDTSVAEVTDVVRENADVAADAVNLGQVAVSTDVAAVTYIKSFKITAVGAGSTYIDVKITDTATSTESHKYIPVKVSSDKKLKSKTAAAIKSEVTDKNPAENEGGTSYTVTFETNGGSAVDPQTVAAGETAKEPEAPKKDGCDFGGWYADSGLTSLFSFATKIEKDTTLYAKWTETADKVVAVTSVALDKETATVNVLGTVKTATLVATVLPENATDKTVTWTSSDTSKATVDANGVVTGVSGGVVTITATAGGKSAACKVGIDFVKVAGTTISGSETWTPTSNVFVSGRRLTIPDLYVCDHEVTRGEFKALMGTDPSTADANDKDGTLLTGNAVLNNPVNKVNWYDAIAYCNKLSIKEGLAPAYTVSGITDWESLAYSAIPTSTNSTWNAANCDFTANGYRLPTEAEWEWLARGGQNYTYAGSDTVGEVAWYTGNTNNTGSRDVKTKAANGYGLYDMSGNVFEWCWDWYSSSISSSTDAAGAASGSDRVRCGGCWKDNNCTVSLHAYCNPSYRYDNVGLRVVRSSSN